tara:strand:- start:1964 stop:2119 length:156 start_codon:yes stop_codon:yes gene_type:complete
MHEAVEEAVEILSMLHLNGKVVVTNGKVVTSDNDKLSEIIHTFNCYLDEGY